MMRQVSSPVRRGLRHEVAYVFVVLESYLPCRFWGKANNFRGLCELLLLYVATIKLAYIEIFPCFNPLYMLL